MFPIDVTLLPSLATRRALLVVDAQNDFLAEDGALPARMPMDLPRRISDLAGDFRRNGGEIIWVQSRFESSRPVDEEQIMTSDTSSPSSGSAPAPRGRRSRTTPPVSETLISPEAFLTLGPGNGLSCVRDGTPGIKMHPVVQQAVGPRDHVLTKTFYSAFGVDELLRLLRMRLVTELFICGSSTNVGVMATAIDAASYGYTITIVDDCCGSQSMSGHRTALRQITNTTGCETLSAAKVLSVMRPKPKPATSERGLDQQYQDRGSAGGRSPTVRVPRGGNDAVAPSPVSDIQPSLERLSLSGEPAAANEYAPETSVAPSSSSPSTPPSPPQQQRQRRQPQSRSQSQSQSRSQSQQQQQQHQQQSQRALQSMARSSHPQTKKQQTDRDTMTPRSPSATANGHVSAATRRPAAGEKMPDGGRHDSGVRSDELVVGAADLVTWGSISSSSSSKRISQQKSSTPPPSAAPEPEPELLRPNTNVDRDNNTKAPNKNKSKGVESPTTTSNNANTPPSSRSTASSESSPSPSEKTPININTRRNDNAASSKASSSKTDSKTNNTKMTSPSSSVRKESEPLCEGDTKVIYDILPADLERDMFTRLHAEVAWQRMSHQGGEVPRLVAVQGLVARDGSKPVYRHPADASPPLQPFTPAVDSIRRIVEEILAHELNHVLIQLYRSGEDYISEHSDKTLDIARDSFIANVSLGAERTMTLRTKRQPKGSGSDGDVDGGKGLKRAVQRATLPHNSLFQMGLATNMRWLHGVRADKRTDREKSAPELACEGARISLTFRQIATYLDSEETTIWGQGATSKTRESARSVINGQTDRAVAMLRAFGRENQDTEFDWEANYGRGFDVLHIGDAKRLFLSGDPVVDLRIRCMLAEFGVSYARGSLAGDNTQGVKVKGEEGGGKPSNIPIRFVDNDQHKTALDGQRAIMLYLQKTYGGLSTENEERVRERWMQGMAALDSWRSSFTLSSKNEQVSAKIKDVLSPWEKFASEDVFIAGPDISLADFAFWPVLADIVSSSSSPLDSTFPNLQAYHRRMRAREGIVQLLGA